jgi:hypothetical protein
MTSVYQGLFSPRGKTLGTRLNEEKNSLELIELFNPVQMKLV